MTFVYVTGLSGSGKSSVLRELKSRGFEAEGVDEDVFADWIDRKSGEAIPFPQDDPNLRIHAWYHNHRWVLNEERIRELGLEAKSRAAPVFLVGVAEGELDLRHLFDKVIVLSVDARTITERLANRTDNDFGKHPEELAEVLSLIRDDDAIRRELDAHVIDARKPLGEVVDEVVKIANG